MAENGNTTTNLLSSLRSLDETSLEHFQNARIITLNIGGNNILKPLLNYLPDAGEFMSSIVEFVEFISDFNDIVSQILGIEEEGRELLEDFTLSDIMTLVSFIQESMPLLDDISDLHARSANLKIIELLPLLYGSFPPELDEELSRGVETFSNEFGEIIKWLNLNAPNAIVVVNTVYNPIPKDFLGFTLELHNKSNHYTQSINNVIFKENETLDFVVSDVYARFAQEQNVADMMNFHFDVSSATLNFDILHPNAIGHRIIAELNYEAANLNMSDEK
jgi:lysophospholipase L1-like esterase